MTVRVEIHGPPASGKSHLARLLTTRLPMLREAHDCHTINGRRVMEYGGTTSPIKYELTALGYEYAQSGNTITVILPRRER